MKRIVGAGRLRKLKGRWQLIVTIEDTETGRRCDKTEMTDIRCSETTNLGRAKAQDALERFKAEVAAATGAHLGPKGASSGGSGPCGRTVVKGLEEYIEYRRVSGSISPTTADAYGYSLLHIKRGFPNQLPGEVTPDAVREWITQSLADGHSNKVMKKAYALLKQYFNYLLTLQAPRVMRNPLDAIPRPRPEEPEPNALRREHIARLNKYLKDIRDSPLKRCCMLSLHTGMRAGETVSVTWGDVDWKNSTITIKRNAVRVRGQGMLLKETKGRERRVAPLDPILARYLADIRRSDERTFRSLTSGPIEDLELYPIASAMLMRPLGTFADTGRISREFTSISSSLGLIGTTGDTITFHGLRHTFASQWIACGGDVAALSAILGHKDVGFTLNVYVSPDPVAQRSGALGMLETISDGYATKDEVVSAIEETGDDAFVRLKVPVGVWSRARLAVRDVKGADAADLLVAILEGANLQEAARGMVAPFTIRRFLKRGMRSDAPREEHSWAHERGVATEHRPESNERDSGDAAWRPLENPFGSPRYTAPDALSGNRSRS